MNKDMQDGVSHKQGDSLSWAAKLLEQCAEVDPALESLLPEDAPEWVHKMALELVSYMQPTAKGHVRRGASDAALLGAIVGHWAWLLDDGNGIKKQWRRFIRATVCFLRSCERKLTKQQQANIVKQGLEAGPAGHWSPLIEGAERLHRDRREFVAKCLREAEKSPPAERAEFFEAYAKALKSKPFDGAGSIAYESFPGIGQIYGVMVFGWSEVEQMSSVTELHAWLCQLLGETNVGDLDRVKGIARRFGIKLASRGRPRKNVTRSASA